VVRGGPPSSRCRGAAAQRTEWHLGRRHYGPVPDEVYALAAGLIAAGIGAGDRSRSCPYQYEWTLIDYAIWAAGAVSVPIYETSSAEQAE